MAEIGSATGIAYGAATPQAIIARMERLPLSPIVIRARILIGFATFFDAYTTLAIAYALPSLIREWHLTPQMIGLVISSGFAGQFFGAIFFGWLAERIGRLPVATITVAIYAVMSIACIFAWGPVSLIAFRFIQGVGLGGEVPVAGAYINEFATARTRGRFFMLYELVFPIGLASAGLLGFWFVPIYGWQVMFVIGALPAILVFILRPLLPESPRWLMTKGRVAEADAIVTRIEVQLAKRGAQLPEPVALTVPVASRSKVQVRELVSGIYRQRTLTVWSLWILSYLILQGMQTWLPTIYTTVFHLPLSTALGFGFVTNGFALISNLTCALVIDRMGRRNWYIMSFFVSAGPLAALCAVGAISAVEVMVLATSGFFFIASIGTSLHLYTGELYPTRFRAFGISIATAWTRLASAASPAIVGFILANAGIRWIFAYFAVVSLVAGVVCVLFMIETKRRVLEELSP